MNLLSLLVTIFTSMSFIHLTQAMEEHDAIEEAAPLAPTAVQPYVGRYDIEKFWLTGQPDLKLLPEICQEIQKYGVQLATFRFCCPTAEEMNAAFDVYRHFFDPMFIVKDDVIFYSENSLETNQFLGLSVHFKDKGMICEALRTEDKKEIQFYILPRKPNQDLSRHAIINLYTEDNTLGLNFFIKTNAEIYPHPLWRENGRSYYTSNPQDIEIICLRK